MSAFIHQRLRHRRQDPHRSRRRGTGRGGGSGPRPASRPSPPPRRALGVLPPSAGAAMPPAHHSDRRELIERLIDTDHAYTGAGDVYFDVPELSPRLRGAVGTPHRRRQGEGVATGKRDQRDFTLWRAPSPVSRRGRRRGGAAGGLAFQSAWRCTQYRRGTVHPYGGMDLVFPHPTRTRSPRPGDRRPVRGFWLHNGWVTMGGEDGASRWSGVLSIPLMLQRVSARRVAVLPCPPLSVDAGVLQGHCRMRR